MATPSSIPTEVNNNSTSNTIPQSGNHNFAISSDEQTAANLVASLSGVNNNSKRNASQLEVEEEILEDASTAKPASKVLKLTQPQLQQHPTPLSSGEANLSQPQQVPLQFQQQVQQAVAGGVAVGGGVPFSSTTCLSQAFAPPAPGVTPVISNNNGDTNKPTTEETHQPASTSGAAAPLSNTSAGAAGPQQAQTNPGQGQLVLDSASTGDIRGRALLQSPFFYYRDFSTVLDEDPLTPLTPLARVPNFPAKMHAILSRPDLADVVAWMPHGRSWRVLKPREFEIRIIPTYFEHQKFSSFIRQANGWGFRRITQGRDRNSYYHELFLRGLPHLCKKMKRPGVNKKLTVDAEHEPDFYEISKIYSLPGEFSAGATDSNILLPCTLMGGPKARMPVGFGSAPGGGGGGGGLGHPHGLDGSTGVPTGHGTNAGMHLPNANGMNPNTQAQQNHLSPLSGLISTATASTTTPTTTTNPNAIQSPAATGTPTIPTNLPPNLQLGQANASNAGVNALTNNLTAATAASFAQLKPNDFISLSALQQAIQNNFGKFSQPVPNNPQQQHLQQGQNANAPASQSNSKESNCIASTNTAAPAAPTPADIPNAAALQVAAVAAALKTPDQNQNHSITPNNNNNNNNHNNTNTDHNNHNNNNNLSSLIPSAQQSHMFAAASLQAANQQAEAVRQAASALQMAMHHPSASAVANIPSQQQQQTTTTSIPPTANTPVNVNQQNHNHTTTAPNTTTQSTMGSDAASQFAAGFAAATAMSDSSIRSAVNQALSSHAAANRQLAENIGNNNKDSSGGGGGGLANTTTTNVNNTTNVTTTNTSGNQNRQQQGVLYSSFDEYFH